MGLLFANDTRAQRKEIEEVKINVKFRNIKVERAFSRIEKVSGFSFVYTDEELKRIETINFEGDNKSGYEVLQNISSQTKLEFRKVNNNSHVRVNG